MVGSPAHRCGWRVMAMPSRVHSVVSCPARSISGTFMASVASPCASFDIPLRHYTLFCVLLEKGEEAADVEGVEVIQRGFGFGLQLSGRQPATGRGSGSTGRRVRGLGLGRGSGFVSLFGLLSRH